MKKKLAIGILISVAGLYWAFQDIQFTAFWNSLRTADYRLIVLASLFSMVGFIIRAIRWKYLLILQKNINLHSVFSSMCIGFFANNVLPMRAGEFLKAYVIGKNENISASAVLATVLVERIIDVLSLLFIALAVLLFFPLSNNPGIDSMKFFGLILILVEIFIITFCVLLVTKKEFTLRMTDKILVMLPEKVQIVGKNIINSFIEGLEIIVKMKHYFILTMTTIGIWVVGCIQVLLILLAFDSGLDIQTAVVASIVVLVLISFALTIPAAPGAVGTFHGFAMLGLAIFSIDPGISSGFTVSLHLAAYIPITLTGFYYFMQENIKFSTARSELSEATEKT